jgi:hypothetical protein
MATIMRVNRILKRGPFINMKHLRGWSSMILLTCGIKMWVYCVNKARIRRQSCISEVPHNVAFDEPGATAVKSSSRRADGVRRR